MPKSSRISTPLHPQTTATSKTSGEPDALLDLPTCFGQEKNKPAALGFQSAPGRGLVSNLGKASALPISKIMYSLSATELKEHTFALVSKHITKHTQVQKHINSCNCVQADCISALTVLTIYSRAEALWVFFAIEQIKIQMYTLSFAQRAQTSSTTD